MKEKDLEDINQQLKDENRKLKKELEVRSKQLGKLEVENKELNVTSGHLSDNNLVMRSILDHHYQLTGLLDTKGRILSATKNALEMVDVEESDVLNQYFWDSPWWEPSQKPEVQAAFKRAVKGEFIRFKTSHINKDGKTRDIDFSFNPVRNDQGKVIYVVPEGRDITDQKKSEEALQISEEKFSIAFNKNPLPASITDFDGIYHDANLMMEKISGFSKEELIGKSIFEMGFYTDLEDHDRIMHLLRTEGNIVDFKINFKIKSGEIRFCRLFSEIVEIQNKPLVISMIHDDTDRMLAEQAESESRVRYRELLETLPASIFEIDNKLNITYINQHALGQFGYSYEDLKKGVNGLDIIAPSDRDRAKATFAIRMEGGAPGATEYDAVKKDGTVFSALLHARPLIKDGKLAGILGILIDISDLKEAKEKIIESEKKFRTVFESANDGLLIIKDNKIIECNSAGLEIFGFETREQIIGKTPTELSPEKQSDGKLTKVHERANLAKVLSGKPHRFNWRHYRKDNSLFDAEVSLNQIILNDEVHVQAIVRDITDRLKSEQDLKKALHKAEESDRLKSVFLESMSHEIRTPLNAIIGFSNIIADSVDDPDMNDIAHQITRQNDLLLNLVNDVLEFSKIEAGELKTKVDKFNLNELVDNIDLSFYLDLYQGNKVEKLKAFDLHLVESDKRRIEQVFNNLIINALKFTREGIVTYGYEVNEKSELVCFVKDTGIGIPKNKQIKIFEKFVKLDSFSQGTGLGLSISKNIINSLGGKIWVESEMGKGSTFKFTIPAFQNDQVEILAKENIVDTDRLDHEDVPKGSGTILVVEDDRGNYLYVEAILRSENTKIIHAHNGLEAVNHVKSGNDIDLVLMDIKMPVMNGLEATAQIRQIKPGLPIIALTAFALPVYRQQAMDAGCTDFISKPVKKADLYALINKHLD